jgi:uncharacterized membrane protein YvlD (DUF360 family)
VVVISWVIDAGAFCLAALVLPGFHAPDNVLPLLGLAAVFATMSVVARPISWALTLPLLLATVLPAILALSVLFLWLTAWIGREAGVAFTLDEGPWIWLGAIGIGVARYAAHECLRVAGHWRAYHRNQSMIRALERTKARVEQERDAWRGLAEAWGPMLEHRDVSASAGVTHIPASVPEITRG